MKLTELLDKKPVSYSAVVLDEKSRNYIVNSCNIQEGWKVYAHHMTIKMGELPEEMRHLIGETVSLTVNKIGMSDLALALGVKTDLSHNKIPHITVAVNVNEGGKPKNSNDIKIWSPIPSFQVTGTIKEI